MKMNIEIKAPRDGVIDTVKVAVGDTIRKAQEIASLAPLPLNKPRTTRTGADLLTTPHPNLNTETPETHGKVAPNPTSSFLFFNKGWGVEFCVIPCSSVVKSGGGGWGLIEQRL